MKFRLEAILKIRTWDRINSIVEITNIFIYALNVEQSVPMTNMYPYCFIINTVSPRIDHFYILFLEPGAGSPEAARLGGISFSAPPSPPLSQYQDIPKSAFCTQETSSELCNGNDLCSCVHLETISLNALVELVLIDEGMCFL